MQRLIACRRACRSAALPAIAAMVGQAGRLDDRQGPLQRRARLRRHQRDQAPRPGDGAELEGHQSGRRSRRPGSIAGDDYVVLVADVYGSKVRPKTDEEAGKVAGPLRDDRATLRARVEKAVAVLRAQAGKAPVDASRIGALGFCFGGTTALELVRSGSELAGVVSLHGALSTPTAGQGRRGAHAGAGAQRRRRPQRHRRGHRRVREGNGCRRRRLAVRQFQRRGALLRRARRQQPAGLRLQRARRQARLRDDVRTSSASASRRNEGSRDRTAPSVVAARRRSAPGRAGPAV